jgi:hypothetical protein
MLVQKLKLVSGKDTEWKVSAFIKFHNESPEFVPMEWNALCDLCKAVLFLAETTLMRSEVVNKIWQMYRRICRCIDHTFLQEQFSIKRWSATPGLSITCFSHRYTV